MIVNMLMNQLADELDKLFIEVTVYKAHLIMLYIQGGKYAESSLHKLEAVDSKHLSTLLGDMLEKKYPNFNPDSFDIDNILDWKLWPGFIKLYG